MALWRQVGVLALLVACGCGQTKSGGGPPDGNAAETAGDVAHAGDAPSANDAADAPGDADANGDVGSDGTRAEAADDAGTGGDADAAADGADGPGPDVSNSEDADGADAGCPSHCKSRVGGFCSDGEIEWYCTGPDFHETLFHPTCRSAPTDSIRFCCAPSFLSACQ
jgi:hypothetical protein